MAFNTQMFKNMPPVTKNLLLINVFVYLLTLLLSPARHLWVEHYFALHYIGSPAFNPAQLITYMFLHGGFAHLFFNMLALFMFGPAIEYALGSKRFLFYYISCGIGAALVQTGVFALMMGYYTSDITDTQYHQIVDLALNVAPHAQGIYNIYHTATVGASGAIYGVLLAFGMLYPNMVVYLLIPPMPVKAKWLVMGYAVLELVLGFSGADTGIAHFCHLGGMLVGLIIILYWKKAGTFHG